MPVIRISGLHELEKNLQVSYLKPAGQMRHESSLCKYHMGLLRTMLFILGGWINGEKTLKATAYDLQNQTSHEIPDLKHHNSGAISIVAGSLLCVLVIDVLMMLDLRRLEAYLRGEDSELQWEETQFAHGCQTEPLPAFFCPRSESELLIFNCGDRVEDENHQ